MWTWQDVVKECEDILDLKDHSELPYVCNLPNLIRDLKFKLEKAEAAASHQADPADPQKTSGG